MNSIVVTRHRSLIELLRKRALISSSTPIYEHIDDIELIKNKDVFGVVPAKLAIYANSITEIPMNIPLEWRKKSVQLGFEIPLEELETMAGEEITYKVEKLSTRTDFSEAIVITFAATFLQYIVREGLIARRGPQHLAAMKRMEPTPQMDRELLNPNDKTLNPVDFKDKPVIGHLSLNMAQYALDITTVDLRYVFERRGQVHDYDEMKSYDHGLLTYKVYRL